MKNFNCRYLCTTNSLCSRGGILGHPSACSFQLNQTQCPYYTAPRTNVRESLDAGDTAPETLEKNVNHPKRYTKGKIECIDALESAVVGKTPEEAICVANVIKYLWRYEEKEPLRSLKSAEWYLKRLISKYDHEANSAHHD